MTFRTDLNNNPAAFTTDIAAEAGLILGIDYEAGSAFPKPSTLITAKLLGDPVAITIKVIDAIGFYTKSRLGRWVYITIPKFVWDSLNSDVKRDVIGLMYSFEGGTEMIPLFPNYHNAKA